ncbi:MAG: lysylphosphatidylglycerol synthase transmembrane domain-containing protein [Thermodesulfobacteriota bacterium]
MMKKGYVLPIKVLVSGGLLYLLFRGMDMEVFWETVSSVSYGTVLFILLLLLLVQTLSTLRWHTILTKDYKMPFSRLFSIYFIGMYFNNFLPTLVGGDLVKAYYIYRETGRGGISLASIFLDRYSGFTALMAITAVATFAGYTLIKGSSILWLLLVLLGSFVVMSLVIWIDLFHGWAVRLLNRVRLFGINRKIDTFYRALMGYKSERTILLKVFSLSLVIQGSIIIGYYILARAVGMDIPLHYFFFFVPIATVVAMIPLSLAGLGIREGAFVFLFAKAGGSPAEAMSISLLFFFAMLIVSLIGGVEYLRRGSISMKSVDTMRAMEGKE